MREDPREAVAGDRRAALEQFVRVAIAIGTTSEELALATIRILENRMHWDSSVQRATTDVRQRYDWNAMVQAILDVGANAESTSVAAGR
jgi:hypothetical protein